VPMGIVIGVCGISALAVDAALSQKNATAFTAGST
jgi:hypothetical protein